LQLWLSRLRVSVRCRGKASTAAVSIGTTGVPAAGNPACCPHLQRSRPEANRGETRASSQAPREGSVPSQGAATSAPADTSRRRKMSGPLGLARRWPAQRPTRDSESSLG
ncbi:esyt3, partial [Symbiodinium pilosum]